MLFTFYSFRNRREIKKCHAVINYNLGELLRLVQREGGGFSDSRPGHWDIPCHKQVSVEDGSPVPPPGELDETYASSLIPTIRSIK